MGGWKLEVFRMAVYIAFPVVTFHYFHQPQFFEDYVIRLRREIYPPENPETRQLLERVSKEINKHADAKRLEDLEAALQ